MMPVYVPQNDLEQKTLKLETAVKEFIIPSDDSPKMVFADLLEPIVRDFRETVLFVRDELKLPKLVAPYVNRIKSIGLKVVY